MRFGLPKAFLGQATSWCEWGALAVNWGYRVHHIPPRFHGCSTTPGQTTMFHDCRPNTRGTAVEQQWNSSGTSWFKSRGLGDRDSNR